MLSAQCNAVAAPPLTASTPAQLTLGATPVMATPLAVAAATAVLSAAVSGGIVGAIAG